jgi:hypothetical protein
MPADGLVYEQQGNSVRGAALPETAIQQAGEILLGIRRVVRVVMDETQQGDQAGGLTRAMALQHVSGTPAR